MRGVLRWLGQLACWVVILSAAAVLTAAVVVPRVGGATPYAVLTGSMRPDHPPGTLVVARPTPFEEIAIGDVVTYQLRSGEAELVTHRVVARRTLPDGTPALLTQGDANDVPDAEPVREAQVKGRLWYSAPYLGYLHHVLTGRQHAVAVSVVAGGLAAYAAAMFAGSVRDRRRLRNPAAHQREDEVCAA